MDHRQRPPQLSPCCWGSLLHCLPLRLFAVWPSSWTHHFLPLDCSQLVWARYCNVLLNPGSQQWCPPDTDLTKSLSIQALDPLPKAFKLSTDSSVCIWSVTIYACRHADRYSYHACCDVCYKRYQNSWDYVTNCCHLKSQPLGTYCYSRNPDTVETHVFIYVSGIVYSWHPRENKSFRHRSHDWFQVMSHLKVLRSQVTR